MQLVHFKEVSNNSPMRKKLMVLFAVFLFVVAVIAVTQALLVSSQNSKAKDSANSFVSFVLAGNADSSYKLFGTKAQSDTSKSDWQDKVARLSLFFTARQPTFQSLSNNGKYSLVNYKIEGNDGTYQLNVVLAKETGGWKVQSFTSERLPS